MLSLENYLHIREKRVVLNRQTFEWVLNGQASEWKRIYSVVQQESILGSLLFLFYIDDRPDRIMSMCKIFADDISFFSKVLDVNESVIELNTNLEKINRWVYQWKMQFNPDPNKQSNEVIFSQMSISHNLSHPHYIE